MKGQYLTNDPSFQPVRYSRWYPINLQCYDVYDADTGELLSTSITMDQCVHRHRAILEHLELVPVYGFPEY